jgi:hypothetical protein
MATRASVSVELPDLPGWQIRFEFELRDGAIRLVHQTATLLDDGAGPAPLYRKLGGRELEQQIAEEFRQDMVRQVLPPDWRAAALETRRSGRQPVTDLELAELAEQYIEAWKDEPRAPMPLLKKRENRSINTLQGLLREAVNRGLLTRNGQGKPGGELTDTARQLLNEGRN